MGSFTVNRWALARVVPHVSDDKERPTLQSVQFRDDGALVATNGRTLAVVSDSHTSHETVALAFGPKFASWIKRQPKEEQTFQVETIGPDAILRGEHEAIMGGVSDQYPHWPTIFPTLDANQRVQAISVDPDLVRLFGLPDSARLSLRFTAPERAIVVRRSEEEDFIGILMPMKDVSNRGAEAIPDWIGDLRFADPVEGLGG